MTSTRRHELTDAQWEQLAPLLPPEKRAGAGRPAHAHRQLLNGILWILRTGAPWRDLPERYGNWQTVYSRFRRWQQAGVWEQVFAALKRDADAQGAFDWAVHFVDGTNIRAHPHAAGARRATPEGRKGATRAGGVLCVGQEPGWMGQQTAPAGGAQRQTGRVRADGGATA